MAKATGKMAKSGKTLPTQSGSRILFPRSLLLLLLLLQRSVFAYYVGPEVGNAPTETKVVRTVGIFGDVRNVTSLAEAAYVPQVYAIGNNVVTFLRSIIPALQPKVDFFAEQIQDTIDTTNSKLMQKLENSNNGIIAVENFFTGLMKAFVFGKGPEEDERRRRYAMALIRSGMLTNVTTLDTTSTTTSATTTTEATTTTKSPEKSVTERQVRGATTTISTISIPITSEVTLDSVGKTMDPSTMEEISSNELSEGQKARDNNFNKMRVIKIMKSMITQ